MRAGPGGAHFYSQPLSGGRGMLISGSLSRLALPTPFPGYPGLKSKTLSKKNASLLFVVEGCSTFLQSSSNDTEY